MNNNQEEWKKSNITESGNYPKNSFAGVLSAIYPTYNENLKAYVLQLDFEDGKTYNVRAITVTKKSKSGDGVVGLHEMEDGTTEVDGFTDIGQFLASIERLDAATGLPTNDPNVRKVQTYFAWMDGNPAGFKTEPNIVGATLYNVATPRQVGDNQQTSKYPDWTIGKIEGLKATAAPGKPTPKTRGKFPKTEIKEPDPTTPGTPSVEGLSDAVLATLGAIEHPMPKTFREVYETLGKKYKPNELRTVFEQLEADGFIAKEGEKYTRLV